MRVINRTDVTITGARPFADWTRCSDADFAKGTITVARAKTYGTAYLLPEFELEEDVHEGVEENRIDIHNVVVDVADDEIEGEEL